MAIIDSVSIGNETRDIYDSGAARKVTSATNGHLAGLDSNGNLTDSGVASSAVSTVVANPQGSSSTDISKIGIDGTVYGIKDGVIRSRVISFPFNILSTIDEDRYWLLFETQTGFYGAHIVGDIIENNSGRKIHFDVSFECTYNGYNDSISGFVSDYFGDIANIVETYEHSTNTRKIYLEIKTQDVGIWGQLSRLDVGTFYNPQDVTPVTTLPNPIVVNMKTDLAILPTKYFTTTIVTSTNSNVTATISNSLIRSDSIIDAKVSDPLIRYSNIVVSNGSCTITIPPQTSVKTITVGIFIR